jgi:hypothetical protein
MVHLMNELLLTQAKLTLLMDPKNNAQRELLHVATNAIQHAHEAREAKAKARQARGPLEAPAKKPDQPDPLVSADIEKLINTTQKVISEAWKKARSLK